ncbi:MAG: hypothetical protein AUK55_11720 [Syntrophobacteraceae bacterium CG2_30_61_12]|nr:MAG: hypothetical protein AUK55_11720 [Syntrophobacteraceae bacterium CG2_30_61_12]
MKRHHSSRFLVLPAALLLVAFSAATSPAPADPLVVTAVRWQNPPTGLDDPAWQRVPAVEVAVKGHDSFAEREVPVAIRAAYTEDRIYLLLRWPDPTRSVTKNSWTFDGVGWTHLPGNEDRIALLFEITRINKFATRGCAAVCHSPPDAPEDQWKLATHNDDESGDLWHWQAARSAVYGYADDTWLTVAGEPSGAYRKTGRRSDTGEGGDVKNETEDLSRPRYLQDPAKGPSVPGFLLFEEAVPITDSMVFDAGTVIPYRLPVRPGGSRFDVKAESRYADGAWTVLLSRKLNTGHGDDVVFDPARRYSFAMAVFDDSGNNHSKATEPLTLRFAH